MNTPLLLDTCALIWILSGDSINPSTRAQIEDEMDASNHIYVSPISAWELGLLQSRNRLVTAGDLMQELANIDGLAWADMSPNLLYDSSFLPAALAAPPSDPGDRIIIATARALRMTIVTRDRKILEYGKAGHVRCLPC